MKLEQFLNENENREQESEEAFQLENPRLLRIMVEEIVWAKAGSMIAYLGNLKFKQSSGGFGKWLKKSLTGEGAHTMKVTGNGLLYLADQGKEVQILELEANEAISVNGNDVLAFQDSITWNIKLMRKAAGMMAGGLFNMHLAGPGLIAFTTHGEPLVLKTPVVTDPQATVAWSAKVQPSFRTDFNFKTLFGKSSGETFQLDFKKPDGFVVIQPYEEGGAL